MTTIRCEKSIYDSYNSYDPNKCLGENLSNGFIGFNEVNSPNERTHDFYDIPTGTMQGKEKTHMVTYLIHRPGNYGFGNIVELVW